MLIHKHANKLIYQSFFLLNMPKNTDVFAIAPLTRLLKKGSGMRVSEEASKVMQAHITSQTQLIAKKAVELSQHAARSTVLDKDILLAYEQTRK